MKTRYIIAVCLLLASFVSFAGKFVAKYPVITEPNVEVKNYISQVSIDRIMSDIQALQDFETRFFQHPNSTLAQNWLIEQYKMLGLEVELQWFYVPSPYDFSASDNIIAIQYGTEFSEEFVVCGAHYDSYSTSLPDIAPGADDNASGTAGILEIARILSQYEFKRSIIYCAWSGEECGLFGSSYYAEQCAAQGMNIVAYFNMDMIGYVAPGEEVKIHFSNPPTANRLADYCRNICEVYFPEVPFSHNNYVSNSDHRSFINVGYMGITTIEHDFTSNPHYHQPDDIIGLGVNSPELVAISTKANIASIATLAMYGEVIPESINDISTDIGSVRVYPNPTMGELRIEVSDLGCEILEIEIFDVYGKLVSNLKSQTSNLTVLNHPILRTPLQEWRGISYDLTNFPSGIYFICINTENGVVTRKIVKQ